MKTKLIEKFDKISNKLSTKQKVAIVLGGTGVLLAIAGTVAGMLSPVGLGHKEILTEYSNVNFNWDDDTDKYDVYTNGKHYYIPRKDTIIVLGTYDWNELEITKYVPLLGSATREVYTFVITMKFNGII